MAEKHRGGPQAVKLKMTTAPDGDPGVLLQLPDGYLVLTNPDQIVAVAHQMMSLALELWVALTPCPYCGLARGAKHDPACPPGSRYE